MTKSRSENTAVNSWRTYGVSNQYLSTHLTLYERERERERMRERDVDLPI